MPPKISDSTPGEKLLALYTLLMLQGDRPISLASIAASLMCSKQTVLRLLVQLEASGYGKLEEPIRKGKEFFYRLAKTDCAILDLGAAELAQLALCRNMLMNLLSGYKAVPGQIQASRSDPDSSPVRVMYKGYIDYNPFESQYSQLLRAIQKHLVCKIIYQKSIFMPPREFCFAPIRLISYHETLSVIGWEVPAKGKVKSIHKNWLWLYIQRCKSVKLTLRHASELPDINLDAEDKAKFGIMDGEEFAVKLLFFKRTSNYVYDRQWSSDQKMTITDDNNLILEMKARSKPEVISWVLGFGPDVKVLSPDWLRDEVLNQASHILKNY